MSCGVGHRRGLHLALPWLWHRPVAAAIRSPPYAVGVALKRQKDKKGEKKKKRKPSSFPTVQSGLKSSLPTAPLFLCFILSVPPPNQEAKAACAKALG